MGILDNYNPRENMESLISHFPSLEDDKCKVLSSGKTITILELRKDSGCFCPIQIIDISKRDADYFMVQIDED